jgi:hypothetical protein
MVDEEEIRVVRQNCMFVFVLSEACVGFLCICSHDIRDWTLSTRLWIMDMFLWSVYRWDAT